MCERVRRMGGVLGSVVLMVLLMAGCGSDSEAAGTITSVTTTTTTTADTTTTTTTSSSPESTTTTTTTESTSISEEEPDSPGPAPVGTSRVGVWFAPPLDQFTPANTWYFDPVGEAIPSGYWYALNPTTGGYVVPARMDHPFVYEKNGDTIELTYPTSNRPHYVTLVDYDAEQDVLSVNWEGYVQQWVGCESGQMPAHAQALCRG
jgi:hypothetical protein